MRRLITCGSIACVAMLLLTCARPLPPDEVLQRATAANRTLRSASFSVAGRHEEKKGMSYTFSLRDGVLQDGGSSLSFHATIIGAGNTLSGKTLLDGSVVLMQGADLFIRPTIIDDATGSSSLLNTWWRLPLALQGGNPSVSSDPSLLRAQSDVVTVSSDLGRMEIDGRESYHYAVTLNHDALQLFLQRSAAERQEPYDAKAVTDLLAMYAPRGELWIDASNFATRRIEWTLSSADGMKTTFRVDLRDVNDAPSVVAPERSSPLSVTGGLIDLLPSVGQSSHFFQGLFLTP